MIEQTRFLRGCIFVAERIKVGGYLLWSKFYLQELIFADRWKNRKKSQKLEPAKFRATL